MGALFGSDLWSDETLGKLYTAYAREHPGWYEEQVTQSGKAQLQQWYSGLTLEQQNQFFPAKQPMEPLWAPSEQVPFTSRTAGVPLSAATFAAGGTEVTRSENTAASGAGLVLLALLAWFLLG